MTTNYSPVKVLCDTDFLLALHIEADSNHDKALEIFEKYADYSLTNLTIYECATVLSRLLPQDKAVFTLQSIRENFTSVVAFDIDWESEVFDLYNSFEKKNISFFDCACQIIAQKFGYQIASFDKFYPKELLVL
ncbi:MAG: PIN domain-containing protein [bacterium]